MAAGGFRVSIFDFRDYAVELAAAGMPRSSLRQYECAARQFLVLGGLLKEPEDFPEMALRAVRAQIITAAKQNAPSRAVVFNMTDLRELPPRFRALAVCLFCLGMRRSSVLSVQRGDVVVDKVRGMLKVTARHFKVLDERSSGTACRPCNCGPNVGVADDEFCLIHGPLAEWVPDLFPVSEEELVLVCEWLGGTSHTFRRSLAVAMKLWWCGQKVGEKRQAQVARKVFMWTRSSMMFPYYTCDWKSYVGRDLIPVHWVSRFMEFVGTVKEEEELDLRDEDGEDLSGNGDKWLIGDDSDLDD
jgi:hypothetical protein